VVAVLLQLDVALLQFGLLPFELLLRLPERVALLLEFLVADP
jgi:hypothetical protein